MNAPVAKYQALRGALAAARTIADVQAVRDSASVLKAMGKAAKDYAAIADAAEIRFRSERRLGEMMEASPKAKGGGDVRRKHRGPKNPGDPVTLDDANIDKNLAKKARAAAGWPEARFEELVESVRTKVMGAAAAPVRSETKKERRDAKERKLAAKIVALPTTRYGIIYADPPWKFEVRSEAGMDRSAENHYPVMDLEAIAALKVPAANNALCLMWATAPLLDKALGVLAAWGFAYKTFLAWDKQVDGTGYWVRSRVELLLIGTRGEVPSPSPGDQFPGLISERRTVHSAKPTIIYEMLETLYPNIPKLEMFAREAREGWAAWGYEAPEAAE